MPYAIIHHFPGGTRSQYEAVLAVVHPDGGLPPGQTYHAAGPSEDGGRCSPPTTPRRAGSGSATGR